MFYTLVDSVQRYNKIPYYKVQQAGNRYGIEEYLDSRQVLHKVTNMDTVRSSHIRIAVVRDPIERFVSIYRDRIIKKPIRSKLDISWEQFVDDFETIRRVNDDIRIHSLAQVDHLGSNSSLYTHIFNTGDFNSFARFVTCDICLAKTYRIHRKKRVHDTIEYPAITDTQIDSIRNYYKEDYAVYGDYFGNHHT